MSRSDSRVSPLLGGTVPGPGLLGTQDGCAGLEACSCAGMPGHTGARPRRSDACLHRPSTRVRLHAIHTSATCVHTQTFCHTCIVQLSSLVLNPPTRLFGVRYPLTTCCPSLPDHPCDNVVISTTLPHIRFLRECVTGPSCPACPPLPHPTWDIPPACLEISAHLLHAPLLSPATQSRQPPSDL